MKGNIIFQNRVGGEITFKITNDHLWERLYHELAFLAESGRGVSFVKGEKKKMKIDKSLHAFCENKYFKIDRRRKRYRI